MSLCTPRVAEFGDLAHLCWAFTKIVEVSDRKLTSISPLTGCARKTWARARARLTSLSASNAKTLHTIETAAFVVVLDTDSAGGEAALENDDDLVRRLHHYSFEKFGGERWFDKSFSIIVNCAGQVGLNVEHSWAEASVPLSVMSGPVASFVRACHANIHMAGPAPVDLAEDKANFLASQRRGHGGLYELEAWDLDEELLDSIAEAEKMLTEMESDSDISLVRCHKYTAQTMKSLRVSPIRAYKWRFS